MVVPPTSLYYALDAIVFDEPTITATTEEVSEESGSGSEVDACQPPPPPVTTASSTTATATAAPVTSHPTSPPVVVTSTPVTSTDTVVDPTVPVPENVTVNIGIDVSTGNVGIGVSTDDIGIGVPGGQAGGQGASSSSGTINGSRGLLPSSLTVCVGLALTAIALTLSSSHSH